MEFDRPEPSAGGDRRLTLSGACRRPASATRRRRGRRERTGRPGLRHSWRRDTRWRARGHDRRRGRARPTSLSNPTTSNCWSWPRWWTRASFARKSTRSQRNRPPGAAVERRGETRARSVRRCGLGPVRTGTAAHQRDCGEIVAVLEPGRRADLQPLYEALRYRITQNGSTRCSAIRPSRSLPATAA